MADLYYIDVSQLVFETSEKHEFVSAVAERTGLDPGAVIASTLPADGPLLVSNVTNREHPYYRVRPARGGVAVSGRIVAFCGYRRQGKIVLSRVELVTAITQQTYELKVRGPVFVDWADGFIEARDFDTLDEFLPKHRLDQEERLGEERAYLRWREHLAQHGREAWWIEAWQWDPKGFQLAVKVAAPVDELRRAQDGPLHYLPPGASRSAERFEPVAQMPRSVSIGEAAEVGADPADQQAVVRFAFKDAEALKEAQDRLPAKPGWLVTDVAGELAQIRLQSQGLDRLASDQACMPGLARLLFDGSLSLEAPEAEALVRAGRRAEYRHLTEDQRVAAALCELGPPLVCVQGPPGTGKTTLSAAVVLASAKDGKRVAVASQSNLAVDNLLGRLPEDPRIRPLRWGHEDRVEPEAQRFLQDRVVEEFWLPSVVAAAEGAAQAGAALLAQAAARAQAREALARLAAEAEGLEAERGQAGMALGSLRGQRTGARQRAEAAAEALARAQAEADAWGAVAAGEAVDASALPADHPVWGALAEALGLPYATPEHGLAALGAGLDPAPVARALAACRGEAVADPAVQALEVEKRRLIDSDREEDLERLLEINKQLKGLRGDAGGWPAVTRALAALQGPGLPDLGAVVRNLTPDPGLVPDLEAFQAALEVRRAALPEARARLAAAATAARAAAEGAVEAAAAKQRRAEQQVAQVERELRGAEAVLDALAAQGAELRAAWGTHWAALSAAPAPAPSREAAVAVADGVWEAEHAAAVARHQRWAEVRRGFLERARAPKGVRSLTERYLRRVNVVGLTCHEAGKLDRDDHPLRGLVPFDRVIVDEVSKATGPELVLPALLARERVVLIGDPHQLPPTFRHRAEGYSEAIAEGLLAEEDFERFKRLVTSMLFEELWERGPEGARAMLTTQFRAHPDIGAVTNVFYGGALKHGPGTERRQHGLEVADARGGRLIGPDDHALWVDSGHDAEGERVLEVQEGSGKSNPHEAALALAVLERIGAALAARGFGGEPQTFTVAAGPACDGLAAVGPWAADDVERLFADGRVSLDKRPIKGAQVLRGGEVLAVDPRLGVGLITLYGAQKRRLQGLVSAARRDRPAALAALDLRLSTVDRFQGMEAPIVLVSLVRATDGMMGNFAKDFRRINVALSRAQSLLVVLGDREGLGRVAVDLPRLGAPGKVQPSQAYGQIERRIAERGGRREASQLEVSGPGGVSRPGRASSRSHRSKR